MGMWYVNSESDSVEPWLHTKRLRCQLNMSCSKVLGMGYDLSFDKDHG